MVCDWKWFSSNELCVLLSPSQGLGIENTNADIYVYIMWQRKHNNCENPPLNPVRVLWFTYWITPDEMAKLTQWIPCWVKHLIKSSLWILVIKKRQNCQVFVYTYDRSMCIMLFMSYSELLYNVLLCILMPSHWCYDNCQWRYNWVIGVINIKLVILSFIGYINWQMFGIIIFSFQKK